jgi:flagellar motor switch protein FliN/FliY
VAHPKGTINVNLDRASLEKRLFGSFAAALAAALQAALGVRPEAALELDAAAPAPGGLLWRQPLPPLGGAAWAAVEETGLETAGGKPALLELLGQAFPAMAQTLAAAFGREVTCAGGAESAAAPPPASWAGLQFALDRGTIRVAVGLEPGLFDSAPEFAPAAPPVPGSKTFDLLLDVELPVSVSFGRAQVPLKDVLKLTTGSIVELDRAVAEPVDIVVNNRVIARGEVVVVEGNFGVRVQQVASPNERLRSLE